MEDYFGKLRTIRVDKQVCEGECFKISTETFSKNLLDMNTSESTGLLLKIFVRNKEGFGYFGYISIFLFSHSLDILFAADKEKKIDDIEIPAYSSTRCRITSIMVGNRLILSEDSREELIRITIVTDENRSFETAISYQDLHEHLSEMGWLKK